VEHDWLCSGYFGNPQDTIRRSKAKRELPKLRAALNELREHDLSYWLKLNYALWDSAENGDEVAKHAKELFNSIMTLRLWCSKDAIDRLVMEAKVAIEATPDTGNVNWAAVHAVDRLRTLWWRNTGNDGPSRALNPESTFAAYLRDGFEYLEMKADPLSAFKRWVAKQAE
jgi:hypothetical protein